MSNTPENSQLSSRSELSMDGENYIYQGNTYTLDALRKSLALGVRLGLEKLSRALSNGASGEKFGSLEMSSALRTYQPVFIINDIEADAEKNQWHANLRTKDGHHVSTVSGDGAGGGKPYQDIHPAQENKATVKDWTKLFGNCENVRIDKVKDGARLTFTAAGKTPLEKLESKIKFIQDLSALAEEVARSNKASLVCTKVAKAVKKLLPEDSPDLAAFLQTIRDAASKPRSL